MSFTEMAHTKCPHVTVILHIMADSSSFISGNHFNSIMTSSLSPTA